MSSCRAGRVRPSRCLAASALLLAAGCAAPDRGAAHHEVEIRDLAFTPDSIVAQVGDTVSWSNRDIVPHTVTGPDSGWESGELSAESTFQVVVTGAGRVEYVCRFHPGMRAVVVTR